MKLANGIYRLSFGTPEELTPVSVLKPQPCYDALNALSDAALPFPKEACLIN